MIRRYLPLFSVMVTILIGCGETKLPVEEEFRGNPISGEVTGVLDAAGGPYLAVDTLRVPVGAALTIEPGVELRFEPGIPFEVRGRITAVGSEAAPIHFTSGQKYPDRGDWDGIWMIDADDGSEFQYCWFNFGARYGGRYRYRNADSSGTEIDSTVWDYGSLTLVRSSPTIKRCWFVSGGFHGLHCDSLAAPTVENSVFYDNAGHGIYVHESANPVLRYNIIVENDDYGVYCKVPGDEPRGELNLWYNIVWSNFSGEYNQHAPRFLGRIAEANGNLDSCDIQFNLRLNPDFQDAENWDFRLNSCSAAIDAGSEAGEHDPDGTRIELGVYPYNYRPGEIRRRITVDRLETARSPYYMSCGSLLEAGRTLTVEPGVEVRVEGLYALRVLGKLQVNGSAESPVRFVSTAEQPNKGDWVGIVLDAGGDAGSEFHHAIISHAQTGVQLNRRDALFDNCTISDCAYMGIYCNDFSSPEIIESRFENNSLAGVKCEYNSSPLIRGSWFTGGAGYGVYAVDRSLPEITNSVFVRTGTDGVRLENLSDARIINNTFAFNGYFGVYCYNNASPDVRNNIFYRNGTTIRGGVGVIAIRTSRPVVEYDCFWEHPLSAVSIASDTTAYNAALNYQLDPGFIDPAADDFHLIGDSPCVDAGDPDPRYNDPDGSRNDLGAFGGPGR